MHLRDVPARQRAARLAVQAGEAQVVSDGSADARWRPVLGGEVGQRLGVAALFDPALAQGRPERMSIFACGSVYGPEQS